MIKIKNISKSFGSKKIFEDFSYTVNDKDFIMITGASGSGKSTLLNMIGNLEKYDAGSIEIDGQVINHKKTAKYYRNTLTYVFQNYGLIHEASVKDNLFPSLKFSKLKKNEKLSAINDALLKVGLNDVLEQQYSLCLVENNKGWQLQKQYSNRQKLFWRMNQRETLMQIMQK